MPMGSAVGIRLRLVSVALLCALPLLALGVYRLATNARRERRQATADVEQAVRQTAARIDQRIRTADALLVALTVSLSPDPRQQATNEAVLRRALADVPSPVANLFLLDSAGVIRAAAHVIGPLGDSVRAVVNPGYFAVVRGANGLVVGELRRSMALADHPWVVVLARAIRDTRKQFAGVVSLTLRLDSMVTASGGVADLGTPLITIFDSSGVVLARSDVPQSGVGQQRSPRAIALDTSGSGQTPGLDGITRLTGFARTRTAPWTIHQGIAPAALSARLQAALRQDLALLALAATLAMVMAYLVGLHLSQPIAALANAARAFERGETGTRAAITGPDEMRLLGSAFNQMAETVERRTAALADSERRYRLLFDGNPLPMWAWDADTLKIMAVNDAAVDLYGYKRNVIERMTIDQLLDPIEQERFRRARLPFSESRQRAGTWLHRTASGRQLAMEVVTTSSRRLGRPSWLSVGIDVTAQREAEQALALARSDIPYKREHASDDASATALLPLARANETILFAEDAASVRLVATAVLEQQGYRVLDAADGDSAIALSQSFPGHIDLLLTDMVMPGMSGRELALRMRRLRPGIRVMFASGYANDEALLGDVRHHPHSFLQKPFAAHELVKRVRGALDLPAGAE